MVDLIITWMFWIGIFCLAAYGGVWIIDKYQLPVFCRWGFGFLLLVVLILVLAGRITLPGIPIHQ